MTRVPLSQGLYALIDDEDYEKVAQFKWCAAKNRDTFYAIRHATVSKGKRVRIRMHQFLMGVSGRVKIDHRNGNGLDNQRRSNLRLATTSQNAMNKKARGNSRTGLKGVSFHKGRYCSMIKAEGRQHWLGYFDTPEAAHAAYAAAAKRYFGEFAREQ
jgi:hypothetical protein